MKLRIELDIDPSEVQLASELIRTLRTLTSHLKINSAEHKSVKREPSDDQAQLASSASAESRSANAEQIPAKSAEKNEAAAINGPAVSKASPVPPNSQAAIDKSPKVPAIANDSAFIRSNPPAPKQERRFNFASKIASFEAAREDSSSKQMIAQQISAALPTSLDTAEKNETYKAFLGAFEAALWRIQDAESSQTLELCYMLPRLPPSLLDDLKKSIIGKAMKHLTVRRPLSANRLDFFAQAVTFAAMVKLEFVLIPGAIQTIVHLLRKEDTCLAAITMLGKTVELCADQLKQQCEASVLEALRAALDGVHLAEIDYDKHYVQSVMGWIDARSQPEAQPEVQPEVQTAVPSALDGQQSFPEPKQAASPTVTPEATSLPCLEPVAIWSNYGPSQVRAVALDEQQLQVASISTDGFVYLHSFDGEELAKHSIENHTFVDMDYNPTSRILVLAGQPSNPNEPTLNHGPMYAAYQMKPKSLESLGMMRVPENTQSVSKLRFLAKGSDTFVAAEAIAGMKQIIRLYNSKDILGSTNEALVPLKTIETEQVIITAVSNVPASNQAFLTADKTGEVFVWQIYSSKPAATLLPPDKAEDQPNASVITCLEVLANNLILAGTYGQGVNIWDLRGLRGSSKLRPCANIRLDQHAVTRLARFGLDTDRLCMVAASRSIHTIRLEEDGSLAEKLKGQKASDKFYWDAKWSSAGGQRKLYAASAAGTLDVYHAD